MPTFNNAYELRATLESIIPQVEAASELVEIVISDNASTDETEACCRSFAQRHPFIRYHRNQSNIGFDLNLLNSMELSCGDYCWLFGDDLLMPNALETAIEAIRDYHPRLLSFNYEYHVDGRPLLRPAHVRGMASVREPTVVRGADAFVRHRSVWFTFISSNVVAREPSLIEATRRENMRGFAQALYILQAVNSGCSVLLPDVGVITQWSTERPATPPPQPTFTVLLPEMVQEWADNGLVTQATAAATIADNDYFIFPSFLNLLLAVKNGVRRGTEDGRRCYSAVLSRQQRWKRVVITCTPMVVVDVLGLARRLLRVKRALLKGPDSARARYRDKFVEFPFWKRMVIVLTPIMTMDVIGERARRGRR